VGEIERGIAASSAKEPFAIEHPVFPNAAELADLKRDLPQKASIWYFRG
jgi:hypothetical protein